MSKKIWFLCLFFIISLTFAIPSYAAESSVTAIKDIPENHWAAEKIKLLTMKKCIYGFSDGTFRPEQLITRAELAAIIVNAAGEKTTAQSKPTYSDVKREQWFYTVVETAKNFFIADPLLKKGLFRPDEFVTRQEAVAAIVQARKFNLNAVDQLAIKASFTDFDSISGEYRNSIAVAMDKKLIRGYADKTFRPAFPLTRAEAATLIFNTFFYNKTIDALLKDQQIKTFKQTPAEYVAVAESLNAQFGVLDDVNLKFFVKEIALYGNNNDKVILIFARVNPFKYFTFSDTIFKPAPQRIKEYAERINITASRNLTGKCIISMVGYSDLILYNTAPNVFGEKYTSYSAADGGWIAERFYAGAVGQDGQINDTWAEPFPEGVNVVGR